MVGGTAKYGFGVENSNCIGPTMLKKSPCDHYSRFYSYNLKRGPSSSTRAFLITGTSWPFLC